MFLLLHTLQATRVGASFFCFQNIKYASLRKCIERKTPEQEEKNRWSRARKPTINSTLINRRIRYSNQRGDAQKTAGFVQQVVHTLMGGESPSRRQTLRAMRHYAINSTCSTLLGIFVAT